MNEETSMTPLSTVSADAAPSRRDRCVDIMLRYLKAEGARVVFGIPGGLLHPFFAAVEADGDLREGRGQREPVAVSETVG